LLYYPHLADTSLRGSISLPREIGIERTNYNLLVVSDKQVRHSTFCACLIATQVLVRHQATPPKKGEKETNDAGEHDPYNEDGYKAVSDSSSYNPRKLQPSSSFSYHHLANKATPSPPPPQRHTDHHHQIDLQVEISQGHIVYLLSPASNGLSASHMLQNCSGVSILP
jgi:hypothetical protein